MRQVENTTVEKIWIFQLESVRNYSSILYLKFNDRTKVLIQYIVYGFDFIVKLLGRSCLLIIN